MTRKCTKLNRVKLTDSVRGLGGEMLQEEATSPDSLSSAVLPSRTVRAREHIRHASL